MDMDPDRSPIAPNRDQERSRGRLEPIDREIRDQNHMFDGSRPRSSNGNDRRRSVTDRVHHCLHNDDGYSSDPEWFLDEINGCVLHGTGCSACLSFRQHMLEAQMRRSTSYLRANRERMNTMSAIDPVIHERQDELSRTVMRQELDLSHAQKIIRELRERIHELEGGSLPRKRSRNTMEIDIPPTLSTRDGITMPSTLSTRGEATALSKKLPPTSCN